ncbi:protein RETICULATA-RELATED 4, chloroplastic-like [Triticum urartu]|uniref:protein RETICULATA-RELATED 4, chloroplastic-like n=1 Tax=Triticum urartu TaxID=4572 RepID=UPI0020445B3E|nr:protein RETICULATA-RELATED 4, chloroplastic-like [Triticum urartu]
MATTAAVATTAAAAAAAKQGTAAASAEALFVLARAGRKLSSLPADVTAALEGGRVTGDIVRCFAEMERSSLLRWLLGFRGFSEYLLADDLFLAKLAMEMGIGMIANVCGIDMDES